MKGEIKINNLEKNTLAQGQVIAVYRERYLVEYLEKKVFMEVSGRFKYMNFQKSEYPQVGDFVNFHMANPEFGIIESVLERRTVLERMDVGFVNEKHILAVNVDIVFICMSLNKDFNIKKLRNFLSLTYDSGCESIVLLTKKDLCENPEPFIKETQQVTNSPVIVISAYDENDLILISDMVKDKTAVLIGSSGVGKSTLINEIIGENYLETKSIRMSDAQGRHATVNRELIHLKNSGKIIDTPGIRIVSSYFVDESNFEDVLSLSEGCMFKNCTHTVEPGCMVMKSIFDGTLDSGRYEQYQKAIKLNNYTQAREKARQRSVSKKMRKGR